MGTLAHVRVLEVREHPEDDRPRWLGLNVVGQKRCLPPSRDPHEFLTFRMGQAPAQVVRINQDVHAVATELRDEVARQSDAHGIHACPRCDGAIDDRKKDR